MSENELINLYIEKLNESASEYFKKSIISDTRILFLETALAKETAKVAEEINQRNIEKAELESTIAFLQDELNYSKNQINSFGSHEHEKNQTIESLKIENVELYNKIKDLKDTINSFGSHEHEKNQTIESLKIENVELYNKIKDLKDTINQNDLIISDLQTKLETQTLEIKQIKPPVSRFKNK